METMREFKRQCDANGYRKGESAADFRRRDPQAAMKLAEFLKANMAGVVAEFTDAVMTAETGQ